MTKRPNPDDIEAMDQWMAHQEEEQAAYEEKHIREMEFEKLIQKACFDPIKDQCQNGKCEECTEAKQPC